MKNSEQPIIKCSPASLCVSTGIIILAVSLTNESEIHGSCTILHTRSVAQSYPNILPPEFCKLK